MFIKFPVRIETEHSANFTGSPQPKSRLILVNFIKQSNKNRAFQTKMVMKDKG